MSDDALAALLQECPEIGPLFEYGGANHIAAEWLRGRGVVVLPPEPSKEMMYAAFMVLEGFEEIPWTLAKTHGEDVQVVTKLLRAALAVLRES